MGEEEGGGRRESIRMGERHANGLGPWRSRRVGSAAGDERAGGGQH